MPVPIHIFVPVLISVNWPGFLQVCYVVGSKTRLLMAGYHLIPTLNWFERFALAQNFPCSSVM